MKNMGKFTIKVLNKEIIAVTIFAENQEEAEAIADEREAEGTLLSEGYETWGEETTIIGVKEG